MCYRISNLPLAIYSLLLLVILIIPQKAKAQGWSEPIRIPSPSYVKNEVDMIIDNNGVLHIVWVERFESNNSILVYTKSTNQGQVWTEPVEVIFGLGYLIYNPVLALYSDNTVLLSYFSLKTEVEQSRIFLKKLEGDTWSDAIAVNGSHDYNYQFHTHSLAIDSNNKAYILWPNADLNNTLIVTYFDNQFNVIQSPTYHTKRFAIQKALFDKNDVLHYSGYKGNTVGYCYYTAEQWLPFKLIDSSYIFHDFTLDKYSVPHFVVHCGNDLNDVSTKFGFYLNNRWYLDEVANKFSSSHSLFIEQNGIKHIVGNFWDNQYVLRYYRKSNDSWTDTILDSKRSVYNKLIAKDSLLYLLSNLGFSYLEIRKMAIENQVGIQEQPQLVNKKINIYPNPARETVNINFFSPEGQATINIVDLQGKQIFSTTVKNSNMGIFDFQWNRMCAKGNAATTGIYFVVIQAGEQVFAEKVVLL